MTLELRRMGQNSNFKTTIPSHGIPWNLIPTGKTTYRKVLFVTHIFIKQYTV